MRAIAKAIFTARCYASAVLWAYVRVCPSVSVTSGCSIETAERIELGFWRVSFLPPVLHCVKWKPGYLQK